MKRYLFALGFVAGLSSAWAQSWEYAFLEWTKDPSAGIYLLVSPSDTFSGDSAEQLYEAMLGGQDATDVSIRDITGLLAEQGWSFYSSDTDRIRISYTFRRPVKE